MKRNMTSLIKFLILTVAAMAILTISQGEARADEVTLSGSTTGTVTGVPQLTFTGNSSFTGTTSLGFGALSGPNSLGTFFLSTSPTQLVAGSFSLNIVFTEPVGINGGQSTTYTATITGSVSPNVNQGGVNITFNQPSGGTVFTFSEAFTTGTFTLTINNVFVQSGQGAPVLAGFTGSQTAIPEPATLLLMGTGLLGVSAKMRRRRKRLKREES